MLAYGMIKQWSLIGGRRSLILSLILSPIVQTLLWHTSTGAARSLGTTTCNQSFVPPSINEIKSRISLDLATEELSDCNLEIPQLISEYVTETGKSLSEVPSKQQWGQFLISMHKYFMDPVEFYRSSAQEVMETARTVRTNISTLRERIADLPDNERKKISCEFAHTMVLSMADGLIPLYGEARFPTMLTRITRLFDQLPDPKNKAALKKLMEGLSKENKLQEADVHTLKNIVEVMPIKKLKFDRTNVEHHFSRHHKEFEALTAEEYMKRANGLLARTSAECPKCVLVKLNGQGRYIKADLITGEVLIVATNSSFISLFKLWGATPSARMERLLFLIKSEAAKH
jgi:hypothetical protein